MQFRQYGRWDFKNSTPGVVPGTEAYTVLQDFGNFAFGSVMIGLGLSYYLTQNAASKNQMSICTGGGSCGTGTLLVQYAFGDQASDAKEIRKGFDYESAVEQGLCTNSP
jgi:hypothetical protein